jgi:hypothetical protein
MIIEMQSHLSHKSRRDGIIYVIPSGFQILFIQAQFYNHVFLSGLIPLFNFLKAFPFRFR